MASGSSRSNLVSARYPRTGLSAGYRLVHSRRLTAMQARKAGNVLRLLPTQQSELPAPLSGARSGSSRLPATPVAPLSRFPPLRGRIRQQGASRRLSAISVHPDKRARIAKPLRSGRRRFPLLALQPVSVSHKEIIRRAGQNSLQLLRGFDQIFDNGFTLGKSCDGPLNGRLSIKKPLPTFKGQSIGFCKCGEGFWKPVKNCRFRAAFGQFQMQRPFDLRRFRPITHALRGMAGADHSPIRSKSAPVASSRPVALIVSVASGGGSSSS